LVAQPHYVSDTPPFRELVKILQKMLNDYYRSCGFLKIDVDNEFMGYIPELIQPCLERITFTEQENKQKRFLNDEENSGPPTNKRVGLSSKFDPKRGGSKSKKRRKSIKKPDFFKMKRKKSKKRRKSRRKRK
jgi:hypothetical protein